jgi:hypothetical protein
MLEFKVAFEAFEHNDAFRRAYGAELLNGFLVKVPLRHIGNLPKNQLCGTRMTKDVEEC